MLDIAQFDLDDQRIEIGLAVDEVQVCDIRLLATDQAADVAQHPCAVGDGQRKPRGIDGRVAALVPLQVNPAVGLVLKLGQRRAVDGVDYHTHARGR